MLSSESKQLNEQLTIRRASTNPLKFQDLIKIHDKMKTVSIKDNHDNIQNYFGSIKVDFANKFIGGGSLLAGKVQQEIMFINRPQLYISMLFCQVMNDNQSIAFIGFRKLFKNKGYGDKVQYDGEQKVQYIIDQQERAKEYIVAIDAIKNPPTQFKHGPILRQINKSLCGFKLINEVDKIATGNWGCGAFGGDPQLKFIIQWISSSISQKQLYYCPFGNKALEHAQKVAKRLQNLKIGQVAEILSRLHQNGGNSVFSWIMKETA